MFLVLNGKLSERIIGEGDFVDNIAGRGLMIAGDAFHLATDGIRLGDAADCASARRCVT
jgi:hypothetical protein